MLASAPVKPVIATDTNAMDTADEGASTAGIAASISSANSVTEVFLAFATAIPRFTR